MFFSKMMGKINTDNWKAAQSFILYLFVQLVKQQSAAALSLNATFSLISFLCVSVKHNKLCQWASARE